MELTQKLFRMHLILFSDGPIIDSINSCSGDSVIISSNENGILNWYANENDFQPIAYGSRFVTDNLYTDTSFFVSESSDTSCFQTGQLFSCQWSKFY